MSNHNFVKGQNRTIFQLRNHFFADQQSLCYFISFYFLFQFASGKYILQKRYCRTRDQYEEWKKSIFFIYFVNFVGCLPVMVIKTELKGN